MASTLETLDIIDVDCKADMEYSVPLSRRRWNQPNDIISASGWQEGVDIDSGIEFTSDTSMAKLWDVTSDHDKVMATLKTFFSSNQSITNKDEILVRLNELNEMLAEDFDEPELKAHSVGACLRFLSMNDKLKYPDIMASPNGTVICQWRKDKHRNLTLEFLPDWTLRFVVFAPTSSETIRVSGRCDMVHFHTIIEPYRTDRWVSVNAE